MAIMLRPRLVLVEDLSQVIYYSVYFYNSNMNVLCTYKVCFLHAHVKIWKMVRIYKGPSITYFI